MRVYLSGPMRGLPGHNLDEFRRVANVLRADGHDVLNPAESLRGNRSDCLRHDIQLIMVADAIVVIAGWEDSPGACFEVAQAWMIDIPVLVYREHYKGYNLEAPMRTSVTIPREDQYLLGLPLVGLSGFAGSGKDEVAKTLVQEGFFRVAFADPLKTIARSIGWNGEKDDAGRRMLQNLGLGLREIIHPSVWVHLAEHRIEKAAQIERKPVVLTDVRFPNEVAMIRRRQGIMVRIVRPGVEAVNSHISEHAIADDDSDLTFVNDCSLPELPAKVRDELIPMLNQVRA